MSPETPVSIETATWPRAEHFAHYRERVPCAFSMTVEVDVTVLVAALRASGRRTYPTQIWLLATVVNARREFRMALDGDGGPAAWPVVHPAFTALNPERETFSNLWAPYDEDFAVFHDRVVDLLGEHRGATTFFPQPDRPPNSFDVSSLPWTSFTSFGLHVWGGQDHLLPIFTLGRYVERDGRTLLPLALQVHHAAADGLHAGRLVQDLEQLVASPDFLG